MRMNMRWIQIFSILVLFMHVTACVKTDPKENLPKAKETTLALYLTSLEAHDFVMKQESKFLFVDVRTQGEVSKGTPSTADANVPIQKLVQRTAVLNTEFASTIEAELTKKGLTAGSRIILICRQGNRSAFATNVLAKAGVQNVHHVIDGMEGWKKNGLPTK